MRILITLFIVCTALTAHGQEKRINLPAFKSVELGHADLPAQSITLRNTNSGGLRVSVIDSLSGQQRKGFGLGGRAKASITIDPGCFLKLANSTARQKLVIIALEAADADIASSDANDYVTFTLVNPTAKSIPLIIPGVMNPNLSPFSSSGVRLKNGQELFYKKRGKKTLLLVVTEQIEEGQKVNVAELIRKGG